MKTVIKILLLVSIALLAYFCVMSVYTPIQFNSLKAEREKKLYNALLTFVQHRMNTLPKKVATQEVSIL